MRKYGTLFVADEIQTGLGRTGKFLAIEHWGVEPDLVLVAKALSGGHIPVGAVLTRKWIFDKLFNRMDRAVVHGSTFAKNDMAMAAGLATLDILDEEGLIENAARQGERIMASFRAMMARHELIKEVRGKGSMIGLEFGAPKSFSLKMQWHALEAANAGLFCQMITIPLFKEHKILVQVAGHASHTIKLLPPLTITEADCKWIEDPSMPPSPPRISRARSGRSARRWRATPSRRARRLKKGRPTLALVMARLDRTIQQQKTHIFQYDLGCPGQARP